MIKLAFLIPVILCFLWWQYLRANGWTLEQGKQGFIYIIGLSAIIITFFTTMFLLTS
jgi:hypothetical protein